MTPAVVIGLSALFLAAATFGGFIVSRRGAWPTATAQSRELRVGMLFIGWFLLVAGSLFVVTCIITVLVRA